MPSRFCTHYVIKSGRPSSGPRTGKGQCSSQFPRRIVPKKVLALGQLHLSPMLVRSCLKSCMLGFSIMWTKSFQIVQARFRKGRRTRNQMANICWIMEKARKFQKIIHLCFIHSTKAFDCVDHDKLWKALRWEYQTISPVSWETCMQAKKQQLEPCMEQLIGSRSRKEYDRAICCHTVCLT